MKNERFGGRSFLLSWKKSFFYKFFSNLDSVCRCSLAEIVSYAPKIESRLH